MGLELVGVAFVILGWIIRSIYKAIKLTARRIKTQRAALPQTSQPIIEHAALSVRPETSRPVVTREATRVDFSNAEQNSRSFEPSPQFSALDARSILPTPKQFPLFENTDDLVRAIILQEILSPPRSRRAPSRQ